VSTSDIYRLKLTNSVPPALIQYPIEGASQTIRSLRYQSQTEIGQFCDITYTVPPPVESGSVEPEEALEKESGWHQELNEQMARLEVEEETAETTPEEVTVEEAATEATTADAATENVTTEEVMTEKAITEEATTDAVVSEEVSEDRVIPIDLGGFEIRIGKEKAENFIMPDRYLFC